MAYDNLSDTTPVDTGHEASPRAVTAFFDTRETADRARQDLVRAGVAEGDIHVASGPAAPAEPLRPHGFWEALKAFFVPDEDRHLYAEGLRRGGVAISVRTDAAAYARVVEILDRDGAVDLEERAADWDSDGGRGLGAVEDLGEREMAYAPADDTTGGFMASRADQPLFDGPMDTAAIEPGSAVPDDPRGDPVGAERIRVAVPGLASPADASRGATAQPESRDPRRTRVRSYLGGRPGDAAPRG